MSFDQCSLSLSCLLNRLLWSSKWLLVALPHNRLCTNQWMFLHQSAYLDRNLYLAGYPGQMNQDSNIRDTEEMYVKTHILLANWQYGYVVLRNYDQLRQVACPAKVVSAVRVGRVEVDLLLLIPRVAAESFLVPFGQEGILTCSFDKP